MRFSLFFSGTRKLKAMSKAMPVFNPSISISIGCTSEWRPSKIDTRSQTRRVGTSFRAIWMRAAEDSHLNIKNRLLYILDIIDSSLKICLRFQMAWWRHGIFNGYNQTWSLSHVIKIVPHTHVGRGGDGVRWCIKHFAQMLKGKFSWDDIRQRLARPS